MHLIRRSIASAAAVLAVLLFPACNRLFDKGSEENIYTADKKAAAGDYRAAVALYEAALDGTPKTAEVHYKLALLYDEKLKSPLDALHHIDRYLELAPPASQHVRDARAYRKEGEARLLTQLAKGSPITQADAVRLKNENEILREQLASLRAQKAMPAAVNAKGEPVQKPIPPGARTYTVESGDTLARISKHFYKTTARARDIQDANFNSLEGTVKIKPGMVLIIP